MRIQHNQDGITLLITLLLMGVLLGISTSLLNITIKQFQLSDIARSSETAFQAASAGMECALYHDSTQGGDGEFAVPGIDDDDGDGISGVNDANDSLGRTPLRDDLDDGGDTSLDRQDLPASIGCMGQSEYLNDAVTGGFAMSGEEQHFQFTWEASPGNGVCSDISVYKFHEEMEFDYDEDDDGVDEHAGIPVIVNGVNMKASGDCPEGSVCTVIQARGYNVPCGQITTAGRVVEREYTQVF